ncbi:MAG: hypothetical protein IJU63_07935 [Bacteroidales bacterium]|nr:hypothetical protein [Bacteroidales bacterium]
MNTNHHFLLLPHRFQTVGWILAGVSAAGLAGALLFVHAPFSANSFALIAYLLLLVGLFVVGFSREQVEDEFTMNLRSSSVLTALLVIFGLHLVYQLALFILPRILNPSQFAEIALTASRLTGFTAVFVLYLVLFKIRLARFTQKEGTHEE